MGDLLHAAIPIQVGAGVSNMRHVRAGAVEQNRGERRPHPRQVRIALCSIEDRSAGDGHRALQVTQDFVPGRILAGRDQGLTQPLDRHAAGLFACPMPAHSVRHRK